jgi:uncharacterized membrane protein YbhN (UPF0104 family)
MNRIALQVLSWLAGVVAVGGIVWYYGPSSLADLLRGLGWGGLFVWVSLTVSARIFLAETAVQPLLALGYRLKRSDAFWIGWVRTFGNQIMPLSGVAAFAHLVRQRLTISWSELAALAAPQFVLALAALGVVGLSATVVNFGRLQSTAVALGAMYLAVFGIALSISNGTAWLIESLPKSLVVRVASTADSLRRLASQPGLVLRLVVFHGVTILFRGGRIWVLFAAASVSLEWSEMLLLLAIAESTMLLNITPGGLGVREGAILGGAALIGVPADTAAGVAVADRLLLVAMTVLFTPPAVYLLRSGQRKV